MHDVHLDDHDEVRMTRRARKNGKSKKRKQRPREPIYKYGVEVPRNMAHARKSMLPITILIDKMLQNGK